jgi:hypothetical protein
MKQTITRSRVLEIVQGYEVLKSLSGIKLAYAISKNMTALKREQESIKGALPKNTDLEKYREEYSVILEAEAKMDENGNFIPVGNGNLAISNLSSFKAKVKVLEEKYAVQLSAQKANEKKFEEFLIEEFDFDFFQFEEANLPDAITVEQIGLLNEMIKTE